MWRYPAPSAAATALRVSSGGVWKTPRPIEGSSTPLFRAMFGTSCAMAVLLRMLLPPAGLRRQFGRAVAVVVRVQRDARCHELIDAVQDLGVQRDAHRRELRLELLHGPRADDRRGDARVVDRPCQCELDHRHS